MGTGVGELSGPCVSFCCLVSYFARSSPPPRPYRRNCADSDRMVAVAVTFISLLHTLLSNHSLGAVLASLADPTVFPLSSVYPGAKLCSSLGLWHGGCLLRNVIKYTLPCSSGPLVPGNTLTHPEELLPAPVFFQGLSLDSAWLL